MFIVEELKKAVMDLPWPMYSLIEGSDSACFHMLVNMNNCIWILPLGVRNERKE